MQGEEHLNVGAGEDMLSKQIPEVWVATLWRKEHLQETQTTEDWEQTEQRIHRCSNIDYIKQFNSL
jgi:hypothetical protein